MKHTIKIGTTFAALSVSALGLLAAPQGVFAQGKPDNPDAVPVEKRVVALDLEDGDLYAAFQSVFKQAKVNYTLDPSLKGRRVTVHIKLPMRQAINTLLKMSDFPYVMTFENDIYSVYHLNDDSGLGETKPTDSAKAEDAPETTRRMARIPIRHTNSLDFAAMFGVRVYLYTSSLIYHGENPYYPSPFGGSPAAAPGAAGGGAAGGANDANGGGKAGNVGLPLPDKLTPDDIFITDADATAFFALYRGL